MVIIEGPIYDFLKVPVYSTAQFDALKISQLTLGMIFYNRDKNRIQYIAKQDSEPNKLILMDITDNSNTKISITGPAGQSIQNETVGQNKEVIQ